MKKAIFHIIDDKGIKKSRWNRPFAALIMALICLSIIEVILESYQHINARFQHQFRIFETATIIVFTIEYVLRVWTADLKYPKKGPLAARFEYMRSAIGIIDLLAILPFFLPFFFKFDLRILRILSVTRLVRIFKLNRYNKSLNLVWTVFTEKRMELLNTIFVTMILILISSTLMYNIEHKVQPDKFPDIISTFWWSIATLTTIGYGDVFPVTGWGKLISGVIAVLGIGLVALPTGILSAAFMEEVEKKNRKKIKKQLKALEKEHEKEAKKQYGFCPHCGEQLPHQST